MGRIVGVLNANGIFPALDALRQIVTLDDELAAMERQITTLKAENLKLKAENAPLQREIDGYKKQLKIKNLHLHDDETSILKLICKEEKAMFNVEISKSLKMNIVRVRGMLTTLHERGLILVGEHWQGGAIYSLSDDGVKYALEQGWA